MRKSVISMILSASLVFGLCPFSGTGQKVSAAAQPPVSQIAADLPSETVSGTFGSNGDEGNPKDMFTWSFNPSDVTLTIGTTDAVQAGKGITPDYTATNYTTAPWYEYHESIKKVVFTGAVEGVGAYSFANDYTALDTVDISGAAKLTTVGVGAFYKAEALATVTGMEQLVTLNNLSFGTTGLKKVNLPNVVSIPGSFQSCKSLQELTMDAVTMVTGAVVQNCTALTKVSAKELTTISGANAFSNTGLTAIDETAFPNLQVISAAGVFSNNLQLQSVKFPKLENYSNTQQGLFQGCTALTKADLPKFKYTGFKLFYRCSALREVNLPEALRLSNQCFDGCSSLVYLSLPKLCMLGNNAFNNCTSLVGVEFPEICNSFTNDTSGTTSGTWPNYGPFNTGCKNLSFLKFGKYMKSMSGSWMSDIKTLDRVYVEGELSSDVSSDNVKDWKADIYVVTGQKDRWKNYPDKESKIHEVESFSSLKKENILEISGPVSVPKGQTPTFSVIRNDAQAATSSSIAVTYEYYKDVDMTTPANGSDAKVCPTQGGDYYVRATTEENADYFATRSNILFYTQYGTASFDGFTVDNESWELTITKDLNSESYASQNDVPWKDYAPRVVTVTLSGAAANLTKVPAYAFANMSSLTTLNLPDTVKEIGASAFDGCTKWKKEVHLTGVTLGEKSFYNCNELSGTLSFKEDTTAIPANCIYTTKLSTITVPDTVKTFGESCFRGNSAITAINVPDGVTEIPKSFIQGCTGITKVSLPETVQTLGDNAFQDTGLTDFTFPSKVTAVSYSLFAGCPLKAEFTVPSGITSIGGYAFNKCADLETLHLPDTVTTIGSNGSGYVFSQSPKLKTITLPNNKDLVLTKSTFSSSYIEEVIIPDKVENLASGAFYYTDHLKKVIIPKTVKHMGSGLFERSTALEYVEFENAAYTASDIESVTKKMSGGSNTTMVDTFFDGCSSPNLVIICDGTTYDTMYKRQNIAEGGCIDWSKAGKLTYEQIESKVGQMGYGWKGVHKPSEIPSFYEPFKAEQSKLVEANYSKEQWTALQKAISEADALVNNQEVSNYQKVENQKLAKEKVLTGFKAIFDATYAKAQAFNESKYDTESDDYMWAKADLDDALDQAAAMAGVEDITTLSLAEMIKLESQLKESLDALEEFLLPEATDTPAPSETPTPGTTNTPAPGGNATPAPGTTNTPAPGGNTTPAPGTTNTPAPGGNVTPAPGTTNTPAPGGNATPAPGGNATPAPGGNATPAPGGNATPAPGGNATPAPGGNATPAPGGNATPAPGGNVTPAPGGNVTPAPGTNNQPNTTPGKVTAPKKVTLKKVKSTKKKTLLVQWKKVSGATGYKVQIAKDKKFKKGKKTYTVKSAKTTKKTIKKLKSKKKYFARVCAYKKASGKTVTGKWSKAKSVKVK